MINDHGSASDSGIFKCASIYVVFLVFVMKFAVRKPTIEDCMQYYLLYRLLSSVAPWMLKVLRYVCITLKRKELVL